MSICRWSGMAPAMALAKKIIRIYRAKQHAIQSCNMKSYTDKMRQCIVWSDFVTWQRQCDARGRFIIALRIWEFVCFAKSKKKHDTLTFNYQLQTFEQSAYADRWAVAFNQTKQNETKPQLRIEMEKKHIENARYTHTAHITQQNNRFSWRPRIFLKKHTSENLLIIYNNNASWTLNVCARIIARLNDSHVCTIVFCLWLHRAYFSSSLTLTDRHSHKLTNVVYNICHLA